LKQADSGEVSNPRNQVLRSDEGIVTNELAEEGVRGTVGAVVIDKGYDVTKYQLPLQSFDYMLNLELLSN